MSFFSGGFGSLVGGVGSLVGGLIGGHQDREFARAQSEADRNFQREVFQNQFQWKAADARKAGLHPLAVLGGGSYSASPSSVPASSMAGSLSSSLGKFGEGIGDSLHAYMTKDDIAAKAAELDRREKETHDAQVNLLNAQAGYYNRIGQTPLGVQTARRNLGASVPMASGRESMPGQVDAPPMRGSGTIGPDVIPGYELTQLRPGRFDINYSSEHQQRLGDEWGQVQNLIDKAVRTAWAVISGQDWNGMHLHDDYTWSFAPTYSPDRRSASGRLR